MASVPMSESSLGFLDSFKSRYITGEAFGFAGGMSLT